MKTILLLLISLPCFGQKIKYDTVSYDLYNDTLLKVVAHRPFNNKYYDLDIDTMWLEPPSKTIQVGYSVQAPYINTDSIDERYLFYVDSLGKQERLRSLTINLKDNSINYYQKDSFPINLIFGQPIPIKQTTSITAYGMPGVKMYYRNDSIIAVVDTDYVRDHYFDYANYKEHANITIDSIGIGFIHADPDTFVFDDDTTGRIIYYTQDEWDRMYAHPDRYDTSKVILFYADIKKRDGELFHGTSWDYGYQVYKYDWNFEKYIHFVCYLDSKKKPVKNNFIIFDSVKQ
jgi:hypothetical protein